MNWELLITNSYGRHTLQSSFSIWPDQTLGASLPIKPIQIQLLHKGHQKREFHASVGHKPPITHCVSDRWRFVCFMNWSGELLSWHSFACHLTRCPFTKLSAHNVPSLLLSIVKLWLSLPRASMMSIFKSSKACRQMCHWDHWTTSLSSASLSRFHPRSHQPSGSAWCSSPQTQTLPPLTWTCSASLQVEVSLHQLLLPPLFSRFLQLLHILPNCFKLPHNAL